MILFAFNICIFCFLTLLTSNCVSETVARNNVLEVQSHYRTLFNLLKTLNLTTYNILERLKNDPSNSDMHWPNGLLSRRTSTQECSDGIDAIFRGLLNGKQWAFTMMDASSKFPPGILLGDMTDLGAYDECLGVSVDDGPIRFKGQHCMISLRVDFHVSTHTIGSEISRTKGITASFCLPSTCKYQFVSEEFDHLGNYVNYFLSKLHRNETVKFWMDDTSCHVDETLDWSPGEITGIIITSLLVGTIVIISIFEVLINRNFFEELSLKWRACVRAFSIASNWKVLTSMDTTDNTIQVLYGFKFLSLVWACFAHRIKLCIEAPLIGLSILHIEEYLELSMSMLILNATLAMETFFLISGILNTYTYFDTSKMKKKNFRNHVKRWVKRYIRLTPSYAMMILITSTWMYRVGEGPLWEEVTKVERDNCVQHWWTNLLYINNYLCPIKTCMAQSWFVAVEMQLFLLSFLVLYPLWRWPKVGLILIVIQLAMSIAIPFVVVYTYDIKTPIPFTIDKRRLELETAVFFVPTHTKLTSYTMGLWLGYGIHLIKRKNITLNIKWKNCLVVWVMALGSTIWAMFGGHPLFLQRSYIKRLHASIYISLFRFCWSGGISWMILACNIGRGGVISYILSWKLWIPLARLSYGMYLTHVAVILYTLGTLRENQYFNGFNLLTSYGGEFLLSMFFAVVLALTIELPVYALTSVVTGPDEDTVSRVSSRDSQSGNSEQLPNMFSRQLSILY